MTSLSPAWAALSRPSNFLSGGMTLNGRVTPGHGVSGPGYPHSLSPSAVRYPAAMTTPILITALARAPRRNPRAVRTPGGRGEGKKPPTIILRKPRKERPVRRLATATRRAAALNGGRGLRGWRRLSSTSAPRPTRRSPPPTGWRARVRSWLPCWSGHDPRVRQKRTSLYIRHHPARRGADPRGGFLGRGQAPDRLGARQPGRGLYRGRLALGQRHRHRLLRRPAES